MRVFLDFEASSLAKASYPIEVAWVFEDGRSESHFIRPLPAWTDWDVGAAALHGITRRQVEAQGIPVIDLGPRMLELLADHCLYASSPSWDGKWLSVLLRGAGLPRHALRLGDTDEAQSEAAAEAFAKVADRPAAEAAALAIIARVRETGAAKPIVHRALADAEHERQLWLEIGRLACLEASRVGG